MVVLGPPSVQQGPVPAGLQAGDVVLMSPVQPTVAQNTIYSAQYLTYPDYDAAFTHVAVYVGNDTVIDSTPAHNIADRAFPVAAANSYTRALRLKGIGPATQHDFCSEAYLLRGQYNYVGAIADALIRNAPLPAHWKKMLADLAAASADGTYYCSQYVNEVYVRAINISVVDRRTFVPLPAAFSESRLFEDVAIHW